MLDLGEGKIAARLADLAGLMVDDPIADARADPSEILARKLVRLRRAVVVDRVRSMDEDAFGHDPQSLPSAE